VHAVTQRLQRLAVVLGLALAAVSLGGCIVEEPYHHHPYYGGGGWNRDGGWGWHHG
jgi:hypothetical protein